MPAYFFFFFITLRPGYPKLHSSFVVPRPSRASLFLSSIWHSVPSRRFLCFSTSQASQSFTRFIRKTFQPPPTPPPPPHPSRSPLLHKQYIAQLCSWQLCDCNQGRYAVPRKLPESSATRPLRASPSPATVSSRVCRVFHRLRRPVSGKYNLPLPSRSVEFLGERVRIINDQGSYQRSSSSPKVGNRSKYLYPGPRQARRRNVAVIDNLSRAKQRSVSLSFLFYQTAKVVSKDRKHSLFFCFLFFFSCPPDLNPMGMAPLVLARTACLASTYSKVGSYPRGPTS